MVGVPALLIAPQLSGAEIAEVQRALLKGSHAIVIMQATAELRESAGISEWSMILARVILTTGKYAEANAAVKEAIAKDARRIQLRWLAREIALALGRRKPWEGATGGKAQRVRSKLATAPRRPERRARKA